jgi:2-polyprenyl-6-methoxyphenol hydroxylase-like FAD-dependent oxidoreductase
MSKRKVIVLGAGFAGMSAALLLARDGHDVRLVDRDSFVTTSVEDSVSWPRKGVAHFMQPHAFIPRGRLELEQHLGDVLTSLFNAGATNIDCRAKIPGPAHHDDEQLQYVGVRRPVLEHAMRAAVLAEPRIEVTAQARAGGIVTERGRVTGAVINESEMLADLVIDAQGRRTAMTEWFNTAGLHRSEPRTSDCGVVYYSRYFRVRPECELPDGPWMLGPRGDLGFLGFNTFMGDNGTFAVLLAVPPGGPHWRSLKNVDVWMKVVESIPSLYSWINSEMSTPITDVLTMAGLANSLRPIEDHPVPGMVAIGDAYSHTDPTLAHGLSFGLIHATQIAKALRDHEEMADAGKQFSAATHKALEERFELATGLDAQREAMWNGELVDFTSPDGAFELFSVAAVGAVAATDPSILRMFTRRMGLLDSTTIFDSDLTLQKKIEEQFKSLRLLPRPPSGPSKDEMQELIRSVTSESFR